MGFLTYNLVNASRTGGAGRQSDEGLRKLEANFERLSHLDERMEKDLLDVTHERDELRSKLRSLEEHDRAVHHGELFRGGAPDDAHAPASDAAPSEPDSPQPGPPGRRRDNVPDARGGGVGGAPPHQRGAAAAQPGPPFSEGPYARTLPPASVPAPLEKVLTSACGCPQGQRSLCGWPGIGAQQCLALGCCLGAGAGGAGNGTLCYRGCVRAEAVDAAVDALDTTAQLGQVTMLGVDTGDRSKELEEAVATGRVGGLFLRRDPRAENAASVQDYISGCRLPATHTLTHAFSFSLTHTPSSADSRRSFTRRGRTLSGCLQRARAVSPSSSPPTTRAGA